MNPFKCLISKTILKVEADTPQVGMDGNFVVITFTDGSKLAFRVDKNDSYLNFNP